MYTEVMRSRSQPCLGGRCFDSLPPKPLLLKLIRLTPP